MGTNGHGPCRLTRQGHLIGITTEARDVPRSCVGGFVGFAGLGWLVGYQSQSSKRGGREVHPTTKTQMFGVYGFHENLHESGGKMA